MELLWEKWPDRPDSMWLRHLGPASCSLSGKKFYAPVQQLTEVPFDFENFFPAPKASKRKVKQRG
jgi:hypothetical protein